MVNLGGENLGEDIGSRAMPKGAPLGENSQGELEPAGPGDSGRGPTRLRSPRGYKMAAGQALSRGLDTVLRAGATALRCHPLTTLFPKTTDTGTYICTCIYIHGLRVWKH